MRPAMILRAQHRTPLIKFIGKRTLPKSVDHTPQVHPASPTNTLPESFASYRAKAQQHGPLGGQQTKSMAPGAIGGQSGKSLGPVQPKQGEYFDRNDLPKRFRRMAWSEEEIDAVTSGGASMWA